MKLRELRELRENAKILVSHHRGSEEGEAAIVNIYGSINGLPLAGFEDLLESIKDEIIEITIDGDTKARASKVPLKNFLIYACLYFDPKKTGQEDVKKRINYLDLLIDHSRDINKGLYPLDLRALELAVESSSVKIVEFLIEKKKANPQNGLEYIINKSGLEYMIDILDLKVTVAEDETMKNDAIEILQIISKYMINTENVKVFPLVLDCILKHKIEFPSENDDERKVLLLKAIAEGDVEKSRDYLNHRTSLASERELMYIAVSYNQTEIISMLQKRNMKVNAASKVGSTILHLLAENSQLEAIDTLKEYEIDIDARNCDGITALHKAAMYGNVGVTDKLIKYGADPNIRDNEWKTPLHYAVRYGNFNVLEKLLVLNANVNPRDNKGLTPLQYAVMYNHLDAARALIKAKANVSLKNNNGDTALDLMKRSNCIEMIALLTKNEDRNGTNIPTNPDSTPPLSNNNRKRTTEKGKENVI